MPRVFGHQPTDGDAALNNVGADDDTDKGAELVIFQDVNRRFDPKLARSFKIRSVMALSFRYSYPGIVESAASGLLAGTIHRHLNRTF